MCHWHVWILQIIADVSIYFCGLDVILGLRMQKLVTLPMWLWWPLCHSQIHYQRAPLFLMWKSFLFVYFHVHPRTCRWQREHHVLCSVMLSAVGARLNMCILTCNTVQRSLYRTLYMLNTYRYICIHTYMLFIFEGLLTAFLFGLWHLN